ncbi:hypothetical protein F4778DRAFT_215576 [Xylariomycetidae sp. FL2044]|nr:hypothetical protein F4778DRAFT_215576 [Xylariomycetidae sp. FL2044]
MSPLPTTAIQGPLVDTPRKQQQMPSATRSELTALSPGKKRRREDDDHVHLQSPTQHSNDAQNGLLSSISNHERLIYTSNQDSNSSLFDLSRKFAPLPVSKKFRIFNEDEERIQPHSPAVLSPPGQHYSSQSYFSHAHPDHHQHTPATSPLPIQDTRPTTSRLNSSALLRPCHICHRKPTKKSDLDSFADCMGCGQRTCFVCIRACQGWLAGNTRQSTKEEEQEEEEEEEEGEGDLSASFTMHDVDDDNNKPDNIEGERQQQQQQSTTNKPQGIRKGDGGGWSGRGHRDVICSRCCVERGSEGDVVCLGCLAGMEEGA